MPLFDTTHTISLQTAIDMTRRYRENKVTILQPSLSSTPVLHDAETFNREAIDRLLAQAAARACAFIMAWMKHSAFMPFLSE
jgi:hypothetical protein